MYWQRGGIQRRTWGAISLFGIAAAVIITLGLSIKAQPAQARPAEEDSALDPSAILRQGSGTPTATDSPPILCFTITPTWTPPYLEGAPGFQQAQLDAPELCVSATPSRTPLPTITPSLTRTITTTPSTTPTPTITPTRSSVECNFTIGASDVTALIGAVIVADSSANPDTICLLPSTYSFNQAYIPWNALPYITSPITIQGNGAILIRNSTQSFRFFRVTSTGNLTLKNITLADGLAFQGGAITSSGSLTLDNTRLFNNTADGGAGGGIYSVNGSLTVQNSELSGNESVYHPSGSEDSGLGGGMYLGSNRVFIDSTIIRGEAPNGTYYASGIYIGRENTEVTIVRSQFMNHDYAGIASFYSPTGSPVVIRQSCFTSNGLYAIINHPDSGVIDARYNWWGADDGPTRPSGEGSGDRVSSRVDTADFLTNAPPGCGMQPTPTPTPLASLTPSATFTRTPAPTWTPSLVPTLPTVTPQTPFPPLPCNYWAWNVSNLVGAIQASNAHSDADTICLGGSSYILTSGPFSSGVYSGYNGLPAITSPITIRSVSGATIRRESGAQFRIFYVASTGSLTLENITVAGGGFDLYSSLPRGGGILAFGPLTLEHCQILDNVSAAGGGVYALAPLTIRNTVFGNNTANAGSAIYVEDSLILESSTLGGTLPNTALGAGTIFMGNFTDIDAVAIIRDSWITNNYAGDKGGAIYAEDAFTPILIDNTRITGNYALSGGGIAARGWTKFVLSNSAVISDNTALYNGGGIYYEGASPADYIPGGITLQAGTRITHNSAATGYGGGIYIRGTEPDDISAFEFTGAQIDSNNAGFYGGGIYVAYGVLTFNQVILANNTAASYGAIYDDSEGMPPSSMHQSCITGNSPVSVFHAYEPALDASSNWWGAVDGPSGVGPGSGDSISDNVLYEPFLIAPPSQCLEPVPTLTPTFTPQPTNTPIATATRTNTPVLACGDYQFEFQGFELNGVVRFKVSNSGSIPANVTGFHLNWAHSPSAGPLASVSLGGDNAFDPAGTVIWSDNDTTSPSVASSGGGEPTWLAEAPVPPGQALDVWFNFNGTTGSLIDLGYNPINFTGSTLTLGGACEIEAGALVPTPTPAPSNTPTPSPTGTRTPSDTPTVTPTLWPTDTVTPTLTYTPGIAPTGGPGCVPLYDAAGTILCTSP